MTEPQIDPSLLEGASEETTMIGRGTKRKTRSSGDQIQPNPSPGSRTTAPATVAGSGSGSGGGRSSTRLAGKTSTSTSSGIGVGVGTGVGVGIGVGVGKGLAKGKGKGKETEVVDDEPARGEEENLIGSEYKLRGKRGRGSRGRDESKSPVKKRPNVAVDETGSGTASGEKTKQSTTRMDGLAAAAAATSSQPNLVIPRPPYPMGLRPFLYPCTRPDRPTRPPGDPTRSFKRFDPHEFDDPKSLETGNDDDLSSDEEDEAPQAATTLAGVPQTKSQTQTQSQSQSQSLSYAQAAAAPPHPPTHDQDQDQGASLTDLGLGDPTGGELDYDTQAYQSLAALLEASNDDGLFGQAGGEGGLGDGS